MYEEIGIRRDQAERAVFSPDVVRHLNPEQVGLPDAPAFSFFSKRVEARQTGAIVVQTMRKATVLTVLGAFPIPHSVMSRVNSLDPIALLAELAEQFGHELRVGNRRAKFIL
jgi:hypothetical protein